MSSPKPLLLTISPPSYSNFTGSLSHYEFNSKFFCTPSRLSTTSLLHTSLTSSTLSLRHAPSDHRPLSTSLCPLLTSPPWEAELSVALLPNSGTLCHPTSVIPTLSLSSNLNSKHTYLLLPTQSTTPNLNSPSLPSFSLSAFFIYLLTSECLLFVCNLMFLLMILTDSL